MIFSGEYFQEIGATLRRNKLRTFLTGFAVAWGVLFLILLLGVGTGIRQGMRTNMEFNGDTDTSVSIYLQNTTIPYKGHTTHRPYLTLNEWNTLGQQISLIKEIYMGRSTWGPVHAEGGSSSNIDINGVSSDFLRKVRNMKLVDGRLLNPTDSRLLTKNIIISDKTARKIFGSRRAVGQRLHTILKEFLIVGVYKGQGAEEAYIPQETFDRLLPEHAATSSYAVMYCPEVRSEKALKQLQQELFAKISLMKEIHPDDKGVIYLFSGYQYTRSMDRIFGGLDTFLWIMGLSTLLIGIVGVANIMLVTVRERMREIGIRKAIGARRRHIISMIITESVIVTLVAGMIGLVLAVGCLALANYLIKSTGAGLKTVADNTFTLFGDPVIPPSVAISVVLVMVISGALAGFIPARKAVRIPAIEAMRE